MGRFSNLLKRIALSAVAIGALLPSIARAEGPTTRPAVIRVAIYMDKGVLVKGGANVEKCLAGYSTFETRQVNGEAIRNGILSEFDVLVCGGGTGGGQATSLGEVGREKVREFVGRGGGYLGICAGAYLASSHYKWSLNILNAKVVDTAHWARGNGNVELALNKNGQSLLKESNPVVKVRYAQGPLLAPGDRKDVPAYEELATFKTEIAKNGAKPGVMLGTTALACGAFEKGRVVAFSPHPESPESEGLQAFVRNAIVWSVNRSNLKDAVAEAQAE